MTIQKAPIKLIATACTLLLTCLLHAGTSRAEVPVDAVWIDVRTAAEYRQGHLEQAKHIPFDGIEVGVARLKLPKDTPLYLYCAVGGRSEVARQRLVAQNYSNVINVGSLESARKLAAQETGGE